MSSGRVYSAHGKGRVTRRVSTGRRIAAGVAVLVVLIVAAGAAQLVRGVPGPRETAVVPASLHLPGAPPAFSWAPGTEGVVAIDGVGTIATYGSRSEVAIASVAKIMTAYVILTQHPLAIGAPGPSITVTPADAATYRTDLAGGQSVGKVVAGETLTERQALELMLIPSANNVAVLLARWDAGDRAAFVAKMNADAAKLGLHHTHYADPSGVSPATVSNAEDQVRLAELAMKIRAFRHIVAMPQAVLPVTGLVYNVNGLVGHDGIIGIKTGSDSAAGGCLVFAADRTVAGTPVMIIGAVLGDQQPPSILQSVAAASELLVNQAAASLESTQAVHAGETVAELRAPWMSAPLPVVAAGAATVVGWSGEPVSYQVVPATHLSAPLPSGATVGHVVVSVGSRRINIPVKLAAALPAASLGYKLTRF